MVNRKNVRQYSGIIKMCVCALLICALPSPAHAKQHDKGGDDGGYNGERVSDAVSNLETWFRHAGFSTTTGASPSPSSSFSTWIYTIDPTNYSEIDGKVVVYIVREGGRQSAYINIVKTKIDK